MSEGSKLFQLSDTMSSLFDFDFTKMEEVQNWTGITPTMEDIETAAAFFSNNNNNDAQTENISSSSPTQITTNQGTKENHEFVMSVENNDLMEILLTQKFLDGDSAIRTETNSQGVKGIQESVMATENNNDLIDMLLPQEFINTASTSDMLKQYPEIEFNGVNEGRGLLTDDDLIFPDEDILYAIPFIDTNTSPSMSTPTSLYNDDLTTHSTADILDKSFLSIFDEPLMQDDTTLFSTSPASTSSISDATLELFLSTLGELPSNINDATTPITRTHELYCTLPSTVFPTIASSTIPATNTINYITPVSSQATSPEKRTS
ncbi:1128_t:CDS:1, partial [Ambispora gerdemannii]